MTKNAIIFSNNDKITRLVANELALSYYSVKMPPSDKNDFDVIIVDLTSLDVSSALYTFLITNTSALKICISNDNTAKTATYFDHHLPFPFSLDELRTTVLLANLANKETVKEGDNISKIFFADKEHRGVTFNNVYIPLSQYEFSTLELLCKNTNECVSRETLKGLLNSTDSNISEVYISHLRTKLEKPFGIKIIYTVRSKGYMTDHSIKYDLTSKY